MSPDPWELADEVVELAKAASASRPGAALAGDDQRRHLRRHFPSHAALQLDSRPGVTLGVFCRDLAQSGVGLLSPRHALPLEQGRLTLNDQRVLSVRVRHCRRLSAGCFFWGCDFDVQPAGGPLSSYGATLAECGTAPATDAGA